MAAASRNACSVELPEWTVPPMATDLASIPGPLWGFIGPYGKQTLPVLLHDKLCDDARAADTLGLIERNRRRDGDVEALYLRRNRNARALFASFGNTGAEALAFSANNDRGGTLI